MKNDPVWDQWLCFTKISLGFPKILRDPENLDDVPALQGGDAAEDVTMRVDSTETVSLVVAMNAPSSHAHFPPRRRD